MSDSPDLPAGILKLVAPNPGPMTGAGTNTYLLTGDPVTVIDPGPDDPAHIRAILSALPGGQRIERILVTHAHRDHTGAVPMLVAETGAEVLAFGRAQDGRTAFQNDIAARGSLGGGEGIDQSFIPDRQLAHGERIDGSIPLIALHTPGHLASHLCFASPGLGVTFTGDHVMGWSTTLISPPDGSVRAFLASLEVLAARTERVFLPGHGPPVADGPAECRRQAGHRRMREEQVLEALRDGASDLTSLTYRIYADLPQTLLPAASRNVLAHLLDLAERSSVILPEGDLRTAPFALR